MNRSAAVLRRPMTADEIIMGAALGFVRVPPATWDKRFVGVMAACARDAEPAITEKEALALRRLVHKYRRQLRAEVLALAGERPANPWLELPTVRAPRPRATPATPQLSLL